MKKNKKEPKVIAEVSKVPDAPASNVWTAEPEWHPSEVDYYIGIALGALIAKYPVPLGVAEALKIQEMIAQASCAYACKVLNARARIKLPPEPPPVPKFIEGMAFAT